MEPKVERCILDVVIFVAGSDLRTLSSRTTQENYVIPVSTSDFVKDHTLSFEYQQSRDFSLESKTSSDFFPTNSLLIAVSLFLVIEAICSMILPPIHDMVFTLQMQPRRRC